MHARPSGATVKVLKTFTSPAECAVQSSLMEAAGPTIAISTERVGTSSYTMPLATGRVPTSAFPALLEVYEDLWNQPNPRPACTRDEYHTYVMGRDLPPGSATALEDTLAAFKFGVDDLFRAYVAPLPIEQNAFVHGDATVSNAVFTRGGPRLIDFSVRKSPPEREVDISKLLFSMLGFDLRPQRQEALSEAIRKANLLGSTHRPLLAYYLMTHAVRVFTREPPRYSTQHLFFNSVIDHAEAYL